MTQRKVANVPCDDRTAGSLPPKRGEKLILPTFARERSNGKRRYISVDKCELSADLLSKNGRQLPQAHSVSSDNLCQCGLGFIIDYDYASMKRRFVDSKPTDILGGKEPRHIFASAAECGDAPKKKGFFKGFWKRSRHYSLENQ